MRALLAAGLCWLLAGCAISWVNEDGTSHELGLVWRRDLNSDDAMVSQRTVIGASIDLGGECVRTVVGYATDTLVVPSPDGMTIVDFDSRDPMSAILKVSERPTEALSNGSAEDARTGEASPLDIARVLSDEN